MSQKITSFPLPVLLILALGLFIVLGFLSAASVQAEESESAAEDTSGETSGDSAIAVPSTCGALQVIGTQLSDSEGNPVQLKGISTLGVIWYPEYINKECFAQFKNEWNVNVIRLAMYTAESGGYCTDGDQSYLKYLVKSGVDYATELDMYAIIDWHILSDGNPNTYIEEAKAFFEEMSSTYADNVNVLYEICNEPNGNTTWADIKAYAEVIIPIIRANDPDAVILIGTPNWSQYVDQAAVDPITGYDNLMYTLHFYAATHTDSLRSTLTSAVNAGLPIFVSEYGICDASGNGALDIDQANQWIALLDSYQISYVMWNLSNRNESSAILKSTCTKTSGFTADDLNESGKWLYEMLTGESISGEDTASGSSDSADASDDGSASDGNSGSDDNSADTSNGGMQAGASGSTGTASEGSVEYTIALANQWESNGQYYFQYTMELENISGSSLSGWTVTLNFSDTFSLSDGWNGEYSITDTSLTITPKSYNQTIEAGGTISDIGFIVVTDAVNFALAQEEPESLFVSAKL
ncbi:MAG: cellulase family glycosylhydrolase [Lachnospiraceae bacterium]|nr:cellulase family glycosylhydrolase [Lachnospiraceae bacterium]